MSLSPIFTLQDARNSSAATLTRAQVARLMDVDPRTVTTAIKNGALPSIRLGRRVLIPRERFLSMFDPNSEHPGDSVPTTAHGGAA